MAGPKPKPITAAEMAARLGIPVDALPPHLRPRNRAGEVARSFAFRHPTLAGISSGVGNVAKGVVTFIPSAIKGLSSFSPEDLRDPQVRQEIIDNKWGDPDQMLHEALRARARGEPVGGVEYAASLLKGTAFAGYNLQRAIQGGALWEQTAPGKLNFRATDPDVSPRERAQAITEMVGNAGLLASGRAGEIRGAQALADAKQLNFIQHFDEAMNSPVGSKVATGPATPRPDYAGLAALRDRPSEVGAGRVSPLFTPRPNNAPANMWLGGQSLSDVRRTFNQTIGGDEPLPRVKQIDEPAARRMAQTYDNLENAPSDPQTRAAYESFNSETQAQAAALKRAGYTWEFTDEDPYPPSKGGSKAMLKDLRENHHIRVYRTAEGQGHPFMSADQNNLFRAVHEILGHGVDNNSFSAVGEENAYRSHAQMYSPEARRALATETRGQNSQFNYGPNSHIPAPQRPFATQKAALWPAEMTGDYSTFPKMENAPAAGQTPGPAVERIVSPTVKGVDGKYYNGMNHDLASEHAADVLRSTPEGRKLMEQNGGSATVRGSQGFRTNTGRQITREEARSVAGFNGQAPKLASQYTQLQSSDLVGTPADNIMHQAGEHPVPTDLIQAAGGQGAPRAPVFGGQFKALDEMLPYLTSSEIARVVSPRGVLLRNSINERVPLLGPDEPLIAAALQGQLARGGYESVLPELRTMYGPDAERFASIWASVSPRQLNENALGMAQDIFGRWRDLGGHTADPRALAELARRSDLPARVPNTLAALTAADPRALSFSGNKVASFFPNLLGDVNPVTLDALQSYGMGINPARFSNYGSYLTGSAQVRRVASTLARETGTPWAPAQAQESMWSTIRALMNLPDAEKAIAGGALPELAGQVTPELAGQQWGPQVFRDVLSGGGAMGEDVLPNLHFPVGDPGWLRSLAETVQSAARKRYRF